MSTIPELSKRLKQIREQKRQCKEKHAELSHEEDDVIEQLVDLLAEIGLTSASITGVGKATIAPRNFPKVTDVEKFYTYLKDNGQFALVKESINDQTLRGWYNDSQLTPEQAQEIGLTIYTKPGISLTKE